MYKDGPCTERVNGGNYSLEKNVDTGERLYAYHREFHTSHQSNVVLVLVQRRRRWTSIKTLGQYLVSAGVNNDQNGGHFSGGTYSLVKNVDTGGRWYHSELPRRHLVLF